MTPLLRKPLSRRTVLRGLGGVAISLPLLHAMEAKGQTEAPRRLVTVFSGNGTLAARWPQPILSPLDPFQSKLTVLRNVDLKVAMDSPGSAHQRGIGALFTGHKLDTTRLFGSAGWAMGPSIDQVVAAQIGRTTRFGSVQLGVQVPGNTVSDRMSYRGATQPLPPQGDPAAVFDALFSNFDEDPVVIARRRAHRKSVLDFVRGELSAVSAKVGVDDRRRLDAHLTSIREIESRLDATFTPGPECRMPSPPSVPPLSDPTKYPELGRLQMDLLAMALICDLTRVASLQWSSGASPAVFTWLGVGTDHHELSHRPTGDASAAAGLEAIERWYSEQFAYLIGKLDAVPEGEGTVLDRSLVIWGNEMGRGNDHDHGSSPFVLAGSAGGVFRTGRVLDRAHASHNDLLTTVVRAFGVPASTFGDPDYCSGDMDDLMA